MPPNVKRLSAKLPVDSGSIARGALAAALKGLGQERWTKYPRCWDFLTECVWTEDQATGAVRHFPGQRGYLKYLVEERPKHLVFCVEKSRRMFLTWMMCGAYLHNVLTRRNQADYIASRKLETSCELLGRLVFMYERIPEDLWPARPPIKMHAGQSGKGYRRIDVPENESFVEAVAEGKDQLRQYTASNILLDEYAFWDKAEESWSALRPTIEGGGHIDVVSTPNLGAHMGRMIGGEMGEVTGARSVCQGVEERNVGGWHVVRVHYTADPEKRSLEWRRASSEGLGARDWRREYEVDWTVAAGQPVFAEEFIRDVHVSKEPLQVIKGRPVVRGWDWGLTPACVWLQVDLQGRVNVLKELVTWNGRSELKQRGVEQFAPDVVRMSSEWFPGCDFRDYADPAGWAKAQTDEKTCADILRSVGVYATRGPVTFTARRKAMVDVLCAMRGGRAAFLIDPGCRMLIEGFEGAYRYDEIGETGRYRETAEKNAWSHPMDALQYAVGGAVAGLTGKPDTYDEYEARRARRAANDRNRVTGY